jgi:hypothetical protein
MAVRVPPRDGAARKAPDEAVLRMDESSVHVSGVHEETDGTFTGTICRLEPPGSPAHRWMSIGDRLTFRASHVFTFTGFDDDPGPRRATSPQAKPTRVEQRSGERRAPVERLPEKPPRLPLGWLGLAAAAVLGSGLALGYVIGRTEEPAVFAQEKPTRTYTGLRIDYELKGQ